MAAILSRKRPRINVSGAGRVCGALALAFFMLAAASTAFGQSKPPVIIIPGLTGSELVSSKNGSVVWFKVHRSKTDDLSLPISPNLAANRDSLRPRDILRSVKIGILPKTDAYEGLITALQDRGGYKEASWDNPPLKGYENTIYVFPYDWRRDNVENARLLLTKIETLKRRLKRPDLKFDVVAHSMGGLIARYAAMYGDADLPAGTRKPVPTWAGAKNFNKIVLLGTPNEGSIQSLGSLINGFSLFGIQINLPFIQNLSRFDLFTIPSAYQLLPTNGAIKAFDADLKPLTLDIYDPKTWDEYGWSAIRDKDFAKNFSASERKNAAAYFAKVLDRAKRLHEALNAVSTGEPAGMMNLLGAECKDTLDAMVVYRDPKTNQWKTIFKADSFERADGKKVTSEEIKRVMYAPGDGVVTRSSLTASALAAADGDKALFPTPGVFVCESHNRLPGNTDIQNDIISLFSGGKVPETAPARAK